MKWGRFYESSKTNIYFSHNSAFVVEAFFLIRKIFIHSSRRCEIASKFLKDFQPCDKFFRLIKTLFPKNKKFSHSFTYTKLFLLICQTFKVVLSMAKTNFLSNPQIEKTFLFFHKGDFFPSTVFSSTLSLIMMLRLSGQRKLSSFHENGSFLIWEGLRFSFYSPSEILDISFRKINPFPLSWNSELFSHRLRSR